MAYLLGARVKRREDPRLITGKGLYLDDIKLPGMLFLSVYRSPYAHAVIKKIDTEKARKIPGVIAVFTGKDLEGAVNPIPCAWIIPNADLKVPKYMPLGVDKVHHAGQAVAVVVATGQTTAKDAAELIDVDYEPLPLVVDAEKAVKTGSPQLHSDIPNNVAFKWKLEGGDVKKAFAEGEVVLKQRMVNQRLIPNAIEPRGAIADYNISSESMTIWVTSQNPHIHRLILSVVLGIPEHRLRVIAPMDVGGGFGSKIAVYPGEALAAFASKRLGKPVKWVEERRENYVATTHGRDHVEYIEVAAKKNGTVLGLKVKSYANLGAYHSLAGPGIPTYLYALMLCGPYKIPAVSVEVTGILTNSTPVEAYRGAGRPEATYVLERVMDILARELRMDPADIRRKNFIRQSEFPYTTPTGISYDSGNYDLSLEKALNRIEYAKLRREQEQQRKSGKLIGIGIASYVEICGLGPSKVVGSTGFQGGLYDSATIRMHPSGKVIVFTGTSPHGQGEETSFAQIVASELEIPIDDVEVLHGDTNATQWGMGTYGSRTTAVGGAAVLLATRKIIEKAKKIAAHQLGVTEDEIVKTGSKFHVIDSPSTAKTLQEIAGAAYLAWDLPPGMEPGLEATSFFDPPNFTFPFGTHACLVEIDKETGDVKVLKYVAADDCGKILNPLLVEGQIHGGVAQGIGQALYEEALYDGQSGQLITGSMMDYNVPKASQIPSFETEFTETPTTVNPLGAKGIGEAGTIVASATIVNGVIDALGHFGVAHIDMPLKPEKIFHILKEKRVLKQ